MTHLRFNSVSELRDFCQRVKDAQYLARKRLEKTDMIDLGTKVRDRVTGVEGIAIARTEWLTGCARITIQPQELKDGKPVETTTVDEPLLLVIEPSRFEKKDVPATLGGPQDGPVQKPSPVRQ